MRKVLIRLLAVATSLAIFPLHAEQSLDEAVAAIEAYDYPRALPTLRLLAIRGDRRAQRLLGFMLLHGEQLYRGVHADSLEAMEWLRKAAAQGDEHAAWTVERIGQERLASHPTR